MVYPNFKANQIGFDAYRWNIYKYLIVLNFYIYDI